MREFKHPTVLEQLHTLLRWQFYCVLLWVGSAFWLSLNFALAAALGAATAMMASWMQKLFFRRLPEELNARAFFAALIVAEVLKWLTVMGLTLLWLLNTQLHALAFLLGFISAYLTHFLLWLKG